MQQVDIISGSETERAGLPRVNLKSSFVLTVIAAYLYVFMEWLFFATKPSFFGSFDAMDKIGAFFVPPLWIVMLAFLPIVFTGIVQTQLKFKINLTLFFPTFLSATMFLIMLDNFLYTLTRWGITASYGVTRLSLFILYIFIFFKVYKATANADKLLRYSKLDKYAVGFAVMLLSCSVAIIGIKLSSFDLRHANVDVLAESSGLRLPNIMFLASDGVESNYLSLYGYQIDTTPFLKELGNSSLVVDNAFANASVSTGSQLSMLSGKLPESTKVGFYPQVLRKNDAFQHLPAILQKLGYTGYQRTLRYFADSGDLNMLSSFDYVNGRKQMKLMPGSLSAKFMYLFNLEALFGKSMSDRLLQRFGHLFAFRIPQRNSTDVYTIDSNSVDDVLEFISNQQKPFFVHLHLMGTHYGSHDGSRPWFRESDFPPGENGEHDDYRYANAIRDADEHFRKIVEYVEKAGLDNTVFVISSDHSRKWSTLERVPLLLHFPGGEHRGHIKTNVSLVDVAPTILDYMGVEIPHWMHGESFLRNQPGNAPMAGSGVEIEDKPVLTLEEFQDSNMEFDDGPIIATKQAITTGPPLFGVNKVGMIFCDQWRKMSLESGEIEYGTVTGHTSPCSNPAIYSDSFIRAFVRDRLSKEGFSVPGF